MACIETIACHVRHIPLDRFLLQQKFETKKNAIKKEKLFDLMLWKIIAVKIFRTQQRHNRHIQTLTKQKHGNRNKGKITIFTF